MFIIYIFRFLNNRMNINTTVTIGINDSFQGFQLSDGSIVNVRIMDTGGQERFEALNSKYYKDADCCLLVYAINSKDSFERIKDYYIKQLNENNKSIIKVMLLGNKTDLEEERVISKEDGTNLAEKYGYIFKETSCVDNYNVSDAFSTIIEMTNMEMCGVGRKSSCFLIKDKNNENEDKSGKKTKKKRKFC